MVQKYCVIYIFVSFLKVKKNLELPLFRFIRTPGMVEKPSRAILGHDIIIIFSRPNIIQIDVGESWSTDTKNTCDIITSYSSPQSHKPSDAILHLETDVGSGCAVGEADTTTSAVYHGVWTSGGWRARPARGAAVGLAANDLRLWSIVKS